MRNHSKISKSTKSTFASYLCGLFWLIYSCGKSNPNNPRRSNQMPKHAPVPPSSLQSRLSQYAAWYFHLSTLPPRDLCQSWCQQRLQREPALTFNEIRGCVPHGAGIQSPFMAGHHSVYLTPRRWVRHLFATKKTVIPFLRFAAAASCCEYRNPWCFYRFWGIQSQKLANKTDNILVLESLLQPNACIQRPMVAPNKGGQGAGFKLQSLCGMQYALCFIQNKNFNFVSSELANVALNPAACTTSPKLTPESICCCLAFPFANATVLLLWESALYSVTELVTRHLNNLQPGTAHVNASL